MELGMGAMVAAEDEKSLREVESLLLLLCCCSAGWWGMSLGVMGMVRRVSGMGCLRGAVVVVNLRKLRRDAIGNQVIPYGVQWGRVCSMLAR